MPGLLFPAFQKFYSSLSSLERFSKEKSFFDNISSLDNFFSEFRNVTFVLQKSLAHTDYISIYENNRQKHLSDCRWFVDKRNETTKQQPFQLVKKIEIAVYFPNSGMRVYSNQFTVEADMELSILIDQFKLLFSEINPIEVFFSAEFSFYEKDSQEDLYDKLMLGIQSMKKFLTAIQQDINEHCDLCEELIKKIEKFNFSILPRDIFLINDYAYYSEKNEFERAQRVLLILGQDKRIPLSCFDTGALGKLGNDYFQKFVAMHAIQQNTELLPTMMTVFQDNTFELDSFNADIKTTIYRKLNENAIRILNEDVKEVYFMQVYVACFPPSPYLSMTSKERLSHSEKEYLTFMKVDSYLNEEEYVFDGAKLSNTEYIAYQVMNGKMKKLDLGKVNMSPIVEAFQKRKKEHS
jgi:hypothetical protein